MGVRFESWTSKEARTWKWRCRWGRDGRRLAALSAALLLLGACTLPAQQPPVEDPPVESTPGEDPGARAPEVQEPERAAVPASQPGELLALVTRVIESRSAEERRGIEQAERSRYDQAPSYDNRLRLALVRAFTAALPSDLAETRADLKALANDYDELSEPKRHLALMALIMVDQRLQMGTQITNLQQQIDSLTEIEATLNHNDTDPDRGSSP